MKSIFSTQNLQTFFLRKYWRLPRRGPPGPPPGPPSRRGPPGPPCPPPGPCPPGRGPLGVDACLCSSAIAAYLSGMPETLQLPLAPIALRREPVASKPRGLGNDRGYRVPSLAIASGGVNPPLQNLAASEYDVPSSRKHRQECLCHNGVSLPEPARWLVPPLVARTEPESRTGLECGADDARRVLHAWPGTSSGA